MNIFNHKLLRPLSAAIFLSGLLLGGCNKKDDGIGAGVLPENDLLGVNVIDTLSLYSTTQRDDSVRADGFDNVILGAMNDPVFGITLSGFYTQLRLSANQVTFGFNSYEVDSVVLALVYEGEQYGYNFPQEYEVYELEEQLYSDSIYFTNRTLDVFETDLVLPESRTQRPAPEDPVYLADDTVKPQLRLRLDHEIGERIIDAEGTGDLDNNTNFVQFFKGLYVTVSDQDIPFGNGGIHHFDLHDSQSKLIIYYTGITDTDTTSGAFDLVINNNAVKFSRPVHDYSLANINLMNQLDGEPSSGQQQIFVQAAAGLRGIINIPHLEEINADSIAINKAELVLPYETNSEYPPPGRVYVLGRNDEGTSFFLPDYLEGDAHMGGFLIPSQQEYRLNISRWVQQVVYGSRENATLEIVSEWASSSANRVVLFGPENPDKQMRLVLHYTKY